MARPKTVDDETLISLIDHYFCEFCADSGRPIKLPELALYIAQHGYPDYMVTTLRRNELARKHIENLQNNSKAAKLATLTTFQTLDINALLDTHTSRSSLIEALSSRDQYYKTIAENSVQFNTERRDIIEENLSLKEQRNAAQQDLNRIRTELANAKKEIMALKKTVIDLQSVIEHYVCSAIAKTILVNEGILPFSAGIVSGDVIDDNMITAPTNVHELNASNVIELPKEAQNNSPSNTDDVLKQLYDNFQ